MAELKDRIEEILSHGISYQEFVDKVNAESIPGAANLSKSVVADILNGNRKPNYLTIVRIAKAFNVSTDYLLGLSDVPATIDDDINVAAKTTGLSVKGVQDLIELKEIDEQYGTNFIKTIERIMVDRHESGLPSNIGFPLFSGSILGILSYYWEKTDEISKLGYDELSPSSKKSYKIVKFNNIDVTIDYQTVLDRILRDLTRHMLEYFYKTMNEKVFIPAGEKRANDKIKELKAKKKSIGKGEHNGDK